MSCGSVWNTHVSRSFTTVTFVRFEPFAVNSLFVPSHAPLSPGLVALLLSVGVVNCIGHLGYFVPVPTLATKQNWILEVSTPHGQERHP